MQLIQTNLQIHHSNVPSQLEFLQVVSQRGSSYFKEEKQRYKSLQAGDEGERKLLQYLQAFGQPHWQVVRNLWLKDFKQFECDTVLITKHCLYIFEVKNYRGTFTYKDGKCFFNGTESPLNPFEQVRANAASIRNYLKRLNIHISVKAAVVFTGMDNEVFIQSEIKDVEVIQSNGIRNFIERLFLEENKSSHHSFTPKFLINKFEQIETTNPFIPNPLSKRALREIKGGLCCANCMGFDLERSKFKILCKCGLEESLEEASIRTICDYSVLNIQKEIRRKEVYPFFNQQVSLSFLQNLLGTHFERKNSSSQVYYEIKPRPYEQIRDEFSIKVPRTFYHKNGERTIFHTENIHTEIF